MALREPPDAASPARFAVTALQARLFRSWRAATLSDLDDPARPFIALYGPNGAGKTNLLEAISTLAPGRGLRSADSNALARRPERIGWRVAAAVNGPQGRAEIVIGAEADNGKITRAAPLLNGKPARSAAIAAWTRMIWLTPAHDRLFADSPGARRRFLDRMALSLFPDHGEAAAAYDKAMRERNRLLKDGVADPRWLGALEAEMAASGVRVAAARRETVAALLAAQTNANANAAAAAFPRAELTIEPDVAADPGALARALAEGRSRDAAAGRALAGPHVSDLRAVYAAKNAPAAACSTGEQKALLVSLALANAQALLSRAGAAPILLLDEIAAHFDPNRRAALFEALAALGAQVWMTGAEAALFADLDDRARRLRISDADGESRLVME